MKEQSYFFSHDVDAFEDIKIKKLYRKFGYEAYGLFWHILEILRKQENYMLEYNEDTFEMFFQNTSFSKLDFMEYCIELKLFVLENNFFYSKSLCDRMKIYEEIIEKKKSAAAARWKKSKEKSNVEDSTEKINANAMHVHTVCNANAIHVQSKCNAIKENKIKQNKTKENKKISIYLSNIDNSESVKKYLIYFPGATDRHKQYIYELELKYGEKEVIDIIDKVVRRDDVNDYLSYIATSLENNTERVV